MGGRPVIVPKGRDSAPLRARGHAIKLALAFAAIYVIWGSTYLAIRYGVETIPPLVTAAVRHSIAGGIMLAWAWLRGFRPKREHWAAGFIVGGLFFLIGHGTLHWAEQYVGSGLAALLIATEPMFILVLAWLMGQQKISRLSALGLGLGALGVALLTAPVVRVSAHHSFAAEFDATKPITLTGTVTKVEMVNPHGWIYIDVKQTDGTVKNWAIEAVAPSTLAARGFRRNTIPIGLSGTVHKVYFNGTYVGKAVSQQPGPLGPGTARPVGGRSPEVNHESGPRTSQCIRQPKGEQTAIVSVSPVATLIA